MGGQIRRGRIWRFWGAPIFSPEVPKPFKNRYLGPLDGKSGRPKNAKFNHDGSDPHLRPTDDCDAAILLRFLRENLRLRNCDCQSLAICDCDCVGHYHQNLITYDRGK